MGLVIFMQIIQPSKLPLAKTLWLLAAFAFTHAISEWGYLFVPLLSIGRANILLLLMTVHLSFMTLSFAFLLAFGLAQYSSRKDVYLLIPALIGIFWYINFIAFFDQKALDPWYVKSEIWGRYLLGFPGALLSGLGLWRRRPELSIWGPRIDRYLRDASVTIIIYSVLTGLIVPPGDFFPNTIINNQTFFNLFHVPVQLVRALLSILLSWYVFRLLSVFRLESRTNLEKIERLESIISERQRIANDIHDGAIQSIYGAGMLLDRASELIDSDHNRSKIVIDQVILRLNETIDSLRRYILDLKSEDISQKDVQQRFKQAIKQYSEVFPKIVIFDSIHLPIWFSLIPGAVDHTYFILQEAIANAAQHANCSKIHVKMMGNEHTFNIEIRDNGIGIYEDIIKNKSVGGLHGHGIRSMEQRARQLSSKLQIKSDQDGTTLIVQILRRQLQREKV